MKTKRASGKRAAVDGRVLEAGLAKLKLLVPDVRGWHYRVATVVVETMDAAAAPKEGDPERTRWFDEMTAVIRLDGSGITARHLYLMGKYKPDEADWQKASLDALRSAAIQAREGKSGGAARHKNGQAEKQRAEGAEHTSLAGLPPPEMTKPQMRNAIKDLQEQVRLLCEQLKEKDEVIAAQKDTIEALKWRLSHTPGGMAN